MKKYDDNYERGYLTFQTWRQAAVDLQRASDWQDIAVGDINLTAIQNSPIECYNTDYSFAGLDGFSKDDTISIVRDTMENSRLTCRIGDKEYLVRDTAVSGILARFGITSRGATQALKEGKSEDIVAAAEIFKKYFKGNTAKCLVRYGKVTGLHSGEDYAVLPMGELVNELETALDEQFPGWQYVSGSETHSLTTGKFIMPAQAQMILDKYRKAIKAADVANKIADPIPALRFTSGDTATQSATLWPMLVSGYNSEKVYPLVQPIALPHRGDASIDKFATNCSMIYAQIAEQAEALSKLAETEIKYPLNTMRNLVKKFRLPAKQAAMAINDYIDSYGNKASNAYECYLALCEISFICKVNGFDEGKLAEIQEELSKIALSRWEEYDIPPTKEEAAAEAEASKKRKYA